MLIGRLESISYAEMISLRKTAIGMISQETNKWEMRAEHAGTTETFLSIIFHVEDLACIIWQRRPKQESYLHQLGKRLDVNPESWPLSHVLTYLSFLLHTPWRFNCRVGEGKGWRGREKLPEDISCFILNPLSLVTGPNKVHLSLCSNPWTQLFTIHRTIFQLSMRTALSVTVLNMSNNNESEKEFIDK